MLSLFFLVASIHFLAVASPGPDFILVVKNAIQHGRKAGIFTAFEIALGMLVHITYCAIGIGTIIAQSILVFTVIKILGAAYLMFLGWKLVSAKKSTIGIDSKIQEAIPSWEAFKQGFLCNVLNPKATLFFVSLFALVLPQDISFFFLGLLSLEMMLFGFLWFTMISLFFSHPTIQTSFSRIEPFINKTLWSILILFGIKVFLSQK